LEFASYNAAEDDIKEKAAVAARMDLVENIMIKYDKII